MVILSHATGTKIGYRGGSPPCDGKGAGEAKDLSISNRSRGSASAFLFDFAESKSVSLCMEFVAQSFPFAFAHGPGGSILYHEEDFNGLRDIVQSAP